jgi:hypothetical protein
MPATTQSPVIEAERRAGRYWFADGLPTLISGVGCLTMATFLHLTGLPTSNLLTHFDRDLTGLLTIAVALFCLVLNIVILIRAQQIVEWLKAKITYARTGYAAPPYFTEAGTRPLDMMAFKLDGSDAKRLDDIDRVRRNPWQCWLLVVVLAAVATIPTRLIDNPWICVAAYVVMAAALWFRTHKDERLSWLVLWGLPWTGWFTACFSMAHEKRIEYSLAGIGLLFLLYAAIALIRYVRRNPVPQP